MLLMRPWVVWITALYLFFPSTFFWVVFSFRFYRGNFGVVKIMLNVN